MTSAVLVWGGNGQLGRIVVDTFKASGWAVTSVDFFANPAANSNLILAGRGLEEDTKAVATALAAQKFDAVTSVAGGWSGGNIASDSVIASVEQMWRFNVQSSVAAAAVAASHLKENGFLLLTGASAALGATPGMIGYGIAKAAVHQLTASLADAKSGLPHGTHVLAILPITLDTPSNRRDMPSADFSSWTPMPEVAQKIVAWAKGQSRPASGSLVEVKTTKSVSEYTAYHLVAQKKARWHEAKV